MNTTSPAPSIYTPAMGHRTGPSLSPSAKQVGRILSWGKMYQSFREAKENHECIPTTFLKRIPMHTKFHQLLRGWWTPKVPPMDSSLKPFQRTLQKPLEDGS